MARFDQLQAFLERVDGAIQDVQLGIELVEREVIARKFRGDHQAHVCKVGGGDLVGGLGRFDGAPSLPKQVRFIARDERKSDVALRDRAGDRKVAAARPIPGEPLALGAGRGGKCRKPRRYFERGRGACLLETRNGHLDGLVRVERLLFKGGQFVALENAPPFAFGDPVFGGAFAPRLGDIPLGGNGSGSPLVLRPHGTAE